MSNPAKVLPTLSVDNVILGYEEGKLYILLVKHKKGRSKGSWGLPGDWMRTEETLEQAASRVLESRTALSGIALQQMHTFSAINRYPGKRIVTTAYYTLIKKSLQEVRPSENELEASWFLVDECPKLIFDHDEILAVGLEKLRSQVRHEPIGLDILASKFTFLQLQNLYEAVMGEVFDKPNFRRKINSHKYLVDCNQKYQAEGHRYATLYRFDLKAYKKLLKQGFSFTL